MYSNCQVAGIVLETMAASGNRRTDLVAWAASRWKFINWWTRKRHNYAPLCIRIASDIIPGIIMRLPVGFVLNR